MIITRRRFGGEILQLDIETYASSVFAPSVSGSSFASWKFQNGYSISSLDPFAANPSLLTDAGLNGTLQDFSLTVGLKGLTEIDLTNCSITNAGMLAALQGTDAKSGVGAFVLKLYGNDRVTDYSTIPIITSLDGKNIIVEINILEADILWQY